MLIVPVLKLIKVNKEKTFKINSPSSELEAKRGYFL